MDVNLQSIFADPNQYFHAFGPDSNLTFLSMDREHFEKSIFLDQRIEPADPKIYRVPANPVMRAYQEKGFVKPGLGYIHHVAQCGSTLLARALDLPSKAMSFREPLSLRQLGVIAGANFDVNNPPRDFGPLLGFALTMLGKRYRKFEPNVVKGNVPTSFIAEAIDRADPGRPAIMLHYGLKDYLAAILRTPGHVDWLMSIVDEMKIAEKPGFEDVASAAPPMKGAALWLNLMQRFQALEDRNERVRALDANMLFDAPVDTIMTAAESFKIYMQKSEATKIAEGPLFSHYGKNPSLPYDPATRIERREETMSELGDEISEARDWAANKASDMGLRERFRTALVGTPEPLL